MSRTIFLETSSDIPLEIFSAISLEISWHFFSNFVENSAHFIEDFTMNVCAEFLQGFYFLLSNCHKDSLFNNLFWNLSSNSLRNSCLYSSEILLENSVATASFIAHSFDHLFRNLFAILDLIRILSEIDPEIIFNYLNIRSVASPPFLSNSFGKKSLKTSS